MTYIPHTDEGFSSPVTDAPVGENAQRFMVGIAPRLSIRDEDAGYARVTEGASFADRVWVYARLAPFTLRLPIFIDVQARLTGTWASNPTVVAATLAIVDESGFYIAGFTDEARFGLSIGPWHNVTFQVFPNDEAEVATAAAEGRLIIAVVTILDMDEGYDVSFLGLRSRPIPLQWRQRTDELGVSGARPARHASTFQATNRARGMV